MNPLFITVIVIAAWPITLVITWAFLHGAQLLRRQEVAGLIPAGQERVATEVPSAIMSIAPLPVRQPEAG